MRTGRLNTGTSHGSQPAETFRYIKLGDGAAVFGSRTYFIKYIQMGKYQFPVYFGNI